MLLVIGVINSGIAAYYYLRVLVALYSRAAREHMTWAAAPAGSGVSLAVLTLLLIGFGIYPTPLISITQKAWELWVGGP